MNGIFEHIWAHKFVFLGTFFVVFTVSYVVLLAVDFLPEEPVENAEMNNEDQSSTALEQEIQADDVTVVAEDDVEIIVSDDLANEVVVLPTKIVIEKLGKTISVSNPTSRSIAELDAALLDGAVRHPDSATLSQEGNVFVLGHSSYLPQVFNKNFQAFNGIQDLEWGDKIQVYSEETMYEYRVERVYRARAQDVTVPIAGTGNMLTLATCNSFGTVDDRYIVEAKQIAQQSL